MSGLNANDYFSHSRLHHLSRWKQELSRLSFSLPTSSTSTSINQKKLIVHVDMDAFFASCHQIADGISPNQPIAVCHGQNTSEVSTCNYAARQYGVRSGMFVGKALKQCPQLKLVNYDFELYSRQSRAFYECLIKADCVQAMQSVSCDEVYLQITTPVDSVGHSLLWRPDMQADGNDYSLISDLCKLKQDIFQQTGGLSVSMGVSESMLGARVATKLAKPNGIFYLPQQQLKQHLEQLEIRELPGVGHATAERSAQHNIQTCGHLSDPHQLQQLLGPKTGQRLWEFANGKDSRRVADGCKRISKPDQSTLSSCCTLQSSASNSSSSSSSSSSVIHHDNQLDQKSLSVEMNWGVRCATDSELEKYIDTLSHELFNRLKSNLFNRLTFKLMVRHPDAPVQTTKYLGCGPCNAQSRTERLQRFGKSPIEIKTKINSISQQLIREKSIELTDIRGLGISVAEFNTVAQSPLKLLFGQPQKRKQPLLTLSQIDQSVLKELPEDVQREVLEELSPSKKPAPQIISPVKKKPQQKSPAKPQQVIEHFLKPQEIKQPQIDYETLFELPTQIRHEVLQDYCDKPVIQRRPIVVTSMPPPPNRRLAKQPTLRKWTVEDEEQFENISTQLNNTEDDSNIDWTAISDYLLQLIDRQEYERVSRLMQLQDLLLKLSGASKSNGQMLLLEIYHSWILPRLQQKLAF